MPAPQAAVAGEGLMKLDGRLRVRWNGERSPFLDAAAARFQRDVGRLTGRDFNGDGPLLEIDCREGGGANEAYSLAVTDKGVTLKAPGPLGVLRGLATLRQLVAAQDGGEGLPAARIEDAPRFVWRGLMIDVARHFMTIPTLKRQIDAMELVKLNVLHLHLSDNEAFRVESRLYPKLQAIASHGQFYSQAEVGDLIAYAAARGVRVVPEIDAPGHVGAILEAYPELSAVAPDPKDPFGYFNRTLDPASEGTYRFMDRLLGEMAGLFPDADFHIGGDEVAAGAWARAPRVQAFMQAHGMAAQDQMQGWFERRIAETLRQDGKTAIGWEEIAGQGLPQDVVVQAWRTSNAIASATAAGHPVIVSAGYYLDLLRPAAAHYAVDPLDPEADGFTPAEGEAARKAGSLAAQAVEPLVLRPLSPLTPEQKARVLGGEAALWSELVDDEMLDARLWPRAAAAAERFWSPAEVRDPEAMYARLAVTQDELRRLGLEDEANRERMAERLAPGQAGPVLTLLTEVEPVRHMAHNHQIQAMLRGQAHPPPQALTSLADAAPADSLEARAFERAAGRFVAGDHALAPSLVAQLQIWRDNDALFAAAARGRPELEAALPVSADAAALAQAGLDAIDALEAGQPLAPEARARIRVALDKADKAEAASARPIFAFMHAQPPADLIIAIAPGVRRLFEAAGG